MAGSLFILAALSGVLFSSAQAEELDGFGSVGGVSEPKKMGNQLRVGEQQEPAPEEPRFRFDATVTALPDEEKEGPPKAAPDSPPVAASPPPSPSGAAPVPPLNTSGASTRTGGMNPPAPPASPGPPPREEEDPRPIEHLPNGWKKFALAPGWEERAPGPPFPPPGEHGLVLESCEVHVFEGRHMQGSRIRVQVRNASNEPKTGHLGAIFGPLGYHAFSANDEPKTYYPLSNWTSGVMMADGRGVSEAGVTLQVHQMGVALPFELLPGQKIGLEAGALPVPNLWGRCGDQVYMELRHPVLTPRTCIRKPRTEGKGDCLIPRWETLRDCKKPFAQETPAFKRCKVVRVKEEESSPKGAAVK